MSEPSAPNYSPFWPLLPVLLVLIVINGFQLRNTFEQRHNLNRMGAQLETILPQARLINETMVGLSRDLLNLAATSQGARQIVGEFQIRQAQPTSPAQNVSEVVTP
ncbi:MAG: hypothetical protein OHK005_02350 [Candidatus Methylacidiphilales bacterium]